MIYKGKVEWVWENKDELYYLKYYNGCCFLVNNELVFKYIYKLRNIRNIKFLLRFKF